MSLTEPSSPGRPAPAGVVKDTRADSVVPLVGAKLEAPRVRPGMVTRDRLIRTLAARSGPAVAALIAPPGYGKTTLLAQWTAAERRPVAWLTIDDLDNDPAVFISYLSAALDRVEPGSATKSRASDARPRRRPSGASGVSVALLAARIHDWRDGGV